MSKWALAALGEVSEIEAGNPAPQKTDDFSSDGVPFVRMQDVGRYGKTTNLIETKDRLRPEVAKKLKKFSAGSILVPKSGASIRLNHRAILGMDACVVSHLAIITPNAKLLNNRFAYYWLCTQDLSKVAHDAQMPSLRTSELAKVKIPLPSLFEQERIVRLLDEAESLRATRERANARMDQFVPALFQKLYDTASNEIISNSNNDWKEMKLGDVCSFIRGPFGGSLKKNVFKSDGYAVYEQRHAIHKDYSEIRYFINEEKFKEMARFELHPGELIMSCSGVTLGRVSIAPENMKPGIINQALLKLTPSNKKISVEFLKLWMESESFQVSIRKYSQGAAIPNVASVKVLKDIPIYLPPLALQREFAARVEEARGVQSAQGKSAERVEALYQSMLSRAFAGEL